MLYVDDAKQETRNFQIIFLSSVSSLVSYWKSSAVYELKAAGIFFLF